MMYNPPVEYIPEQYIVTSTGNIVSRRANIFKAQSVEIPNGRCIIEDDVIIRGDLAAVQINKYSLIDSRSVLRPCFVTTVSSTTGQKLLKFVPQTIGSHCYIGKDCLVESAVIGIGCIIEDNCILSKRSILKDYVLVVRGSVVPSDMVIPPFSIVAGNPAKIIGELPESTSTMGQTAAVDRYKSYVPRK